jgi:hypothetical protein
MLAEHIQGRGCAVLFLIFPSSRRLLIVLDVWLHDFSPILFSSICANELHIFEHHVQTSSTCFIIDPPTSWEPPLNLMCLGLCLGSSFKARRVDPLTIVSTILQANASGNQVARQSLASSAVRFGPKATQQWCKLSSCYYVNHTLTAIKSLPCLRVGLCHDGASYVGEDTLVSIACLPHVKQVMMLPFVCVRRVAVVDDCKLTDELEAVVCTRTNMSGISWCE